KGADILIKEDLDDDNNKDNTEEDIEVTPEVEEQLDISSRLAV
ncbi:7892_t:CDS:1, partial [Scutellospora calospora]